MPHSKRRIDLGVRFDIRHSDSWLLVMIGTRDGGYLGFNAVRFAGAYDQDMQQLAERKMVRGYRIEFAVCNRRKCCRSIKPSGVSWFHERLTVRRSGASLGN